ncbi:MAG: cell division protein FtsZ [Bacteriovoracaceae bacterium]|jgi:cell division protein FtsZ|nr:cell division protein FtsZ [Bacteriovoracaceae bacterium]
MFEISSDVSEQGAKIKVVGIGGGGCNAVNTMIRAGLTGVEYIVANTDAQALNANLAPTKVQLGAEITKGLGAGANPEVGRKAALDEYEKLGEVLDGADMVFITAGMGGGTGTGAAPVVAKLAKELGALTVGVVTKPFVFEGKKRFRQAESGIHTLEENVDSLITIPNQRLLFLAGESLSLIDTFKKADEVLLNAVRGISDLINNTGHINADFADVSTVMCEKGLALMGTGIATGPDRAIKAANDAISSPLLEDITIDGATGIIINITGSDTLTMHETNEAVTLIMEAADEDAEIIFGTVIDDAMEDSVKVTVVATGLGGQERVSVRPTQVPVKTKEAVALKSEARADLREVSNVKEVERSEAMAEEQIETMATETAERNFEELPLEDFQEQTFEESELMRNIKAAASNYEKNPASATTERTLQISREQSRAKSIAEKLGFINFDEEELDKPSYLRKEDNNRFETRQ